MHFDFPNTFNTNLGCMIEYEGGSALMFKYGNYENIVISFQTTTNTYIDFYLPEMPPCDKDQTGFPSDIPASFKFKRAEYWALIKDTGS